MRDLSSNISPVSTLAPAARTGTANGAGVDLQGYDAAAVVINIGDVTGTSPTATIKIQDSADNSTFADVAAADLVDGGAEIALTDTTNDAQVHKRSYIGSKRYLRVALTAISGTGATVPSSAEIVRGRPSLSPV